MQNKAQTWFLRDAHLRVIVKCCFGYTYVILSCRLSKGGSCNPSLSPDPIPTPKFELALRDRVARILPSHLLLLILRLIRNSFSELATLDLRRVVGLLPALRLPPPAFLKLSRRRLILAIECRRIFSLFSLASLVSSSVGLYRFAAPPMPVWYPVSRRTTPGACMSCSRRAISSSSSSSVPCSNFFDSQILPAPPTPVLNRRPRLPPLPPISRRTDEESRSWLGRRASWGEEVVMLPE